MLPPMGQTRVDLQHLLEDLRDAYPDAIEETILSEIVANALDSGATSVRVLTDPSEKTVVVVDDGCGMGRRELARYHDLAASTKTRGEGIGFAGVGIKLGLLVAEAVLTETRRGSVHVATRWHLASRQKAPWQWVAPPGWVGERGTAVGLKLQNPLSPLLDAGFVEARLRLHYEPLFDAAFDEILSERYPSGIGFWVNGRPMPRRRAGESGERAALVVRLPRKRKPAAFGFLARVSSPLPEDLQGLAISTLGKVIRRGWDWIGLTSSSPGLVGGLIEAPGSRRPSPSTRATSCARGGGGSRTWATARPSRKPCRPSSPRGARRATARTRRAGGRPVPSSGTSRRCSWTWPASSRPWRRSSSAGREGSGGCRPGARARRRRLAPW